uniref:Uncharacterized protein n=1 Tax=Rangifer tarandus platyrhynchus TaxID=3082113 RepID=A0ACB0FHF5_RANTA|nr:unnamed protein product [Rangifer tarandus platyrhynchus]
MPSVLRGACFRSEPQAGPPVGPGSLGVRLRAGQAWAPSWRGRALSPLPSARTRPAPPAWGAPRARAASSPRCSLCFRDGVGGLWSVWRGQAGRRPGGARGPGKAENWAQPPDLRGAVSPAAGACRKPSCWHVSGVSGGGGGRKPWAVVRKAGEEGHHSGRRAGRGSPSRGRGRAACFPTCFLQP